MLTVQCQMSLFVEKNNRKNVYLLADGVYRQIVRPSCEPKCLNDMLSSTKADLKEDDIEELSEGTVIRFRADGIWSYTDGSSVWYRTDPNHTHTDYRDDDLVSFKGDKIEKNDIPKYICEFFPDLNDAPFHANVNEGRTGYIPFPVGSNLPLVKGKCKSGRPFIAFRCSNGHPHVFQQRYASYLDSRHRDFWLYSGDSIAILRSIKGHVLKDSTELRAAIQELRGVPSPADDVIIKSECIPNTSNGMHQKDKEPPDSDDEENLPLSLRVQRGSTESGRKRKQHAKNASSK